MKDAAPDTAWIDRIDVVGGHPALDFVNTVHTRLDPAAHDYLESPAHLVGWFLYQGFIDAEDARRWAGIAPSRGRRLLAVARDLRETLNRLFQARLEGRSDKSAVARFNRKLGKLSHWRTLAASGDGFDWRYRLEFDHPESLFAPLVFAAVQLLTSPELARLKACPMESCGWLFLDRSRNGSRNWCSMKTCGNVAKIRRYRARRAEVGET